MAVAGCGAGLWMGGGTETYLSPTARQKPTGLRTQCSLGQYLMVCAYVTHVMFALALTQIICGLAQKRTMRMTWF